MKSHNIRKTAIKWLYLSLLVSACATVKNASDKPIITINQIPVGTDEFMYVFEKNNINQNQEVVTEADIRDYLDLFVNFKLKVAEAESQGLHQDSSFIKELEGYRKQLAQPYLTETNLLDSLVKVTYKRMGQEVNASHILITLPAEAAPGDTTVAYQKVMDLKQQIKAGADFNALAHEFSNDPSAKQNRGNLGYFSAMQMVYAFEDAAYNLDINDVSAPVRTRFGYHLVKLHDKRPAKGKILVSHILIRANEAIPTQDSIAAAEKASEIYKLAQAGQEDWDQLCRQFSEDTGTKTKGGTLPWFKTGDVSNIPNFEKAAFALTEVGAISEPVKTAYGWHIIRLENRSGLEPLEELEPKIKASLSRNSRGDLNRQALIRRLKKENNFQEQPNALEAALIHANDSLGLGLWQADMAWDDKTQTLFTIADKPYLLADFYQYLEAEQPLRAGASAKQKMNAAYTKFAEDLLINYEEDHLSMKYPEYKMLYQEYRDGLLLFQLMEEKIWNKAVSDTSGLNAFFKRNRSQYQWGERVKATIFNAIDEATLQRVQTFIDQGSMEYLKYDFSGSEGSLNKAQIRILDNIAQQLKQSADRYLVLKYAQKDNYQMIRDLLMTHLTNYKVHHRVQESVVTDEQGFQAYVASTSPKDLADLLNLKQPLTLQYETGRFNKGENEILDTFEWKPGQNTMQKDGRWLLINIQEIIPAGYQELDEIKGKVISDYQEELEKEWIKELKVKYQVTINEKAVENVYKQFEK